MKSMKILILAVVTCGMFYSCSKENNTHLKVRLTDNPTALEEVNIDLREVQVNFRQDTAGWIKMDTKAGMYNLLGLQNGVDTLIASGTYPTNMVREIRFVLGPNNNVKESGTTYPLTIPSGSESGLKLKIDKNLTEGLDSLIIDFDAALSVRQESDGYKLRPVLKVK